MSIVRSVPWCESVDAKLDRAKEHLDAVAASLDEYTHRRPTFLVKTNPANDAAWVVWWIDDPHPPMSASIRIGEFLYNLRSALDNLVCALVRKEKGTAGAKCGGSGFPIHTDCDVYEREAARSLKGVPPSARSLIYGLQPFSRGNTSSIDPLNLLNLLRNRDTHRALVLGLAYRKNIQVLIHDSVSKNLIAHASLPDTVYPGSGSPIIPLAVRASELPERVDVSFGSSGNIRFREEGPWDDRPVSEVLSTCFDYVEQRVVARFTPFFS